MALVNALIASSCLYSTWLASSEMSSLSWPRTSLIDLASLKERIDQHLHGFHRVVELLITLCIFYVAGDHEPTVSLKRVASTGSRVMDLVLAQAIAAVLVSVEPPEQLLVGGWSVLVDVLDARQHDRGRFSVLPT